MKRGGSKAASERVVRPRSPCRRQLGKSHFAPVRNVTKVGSRIAAFLWVGVDSCFSRGRRVKPSRCVTRRPGVDLSDLEHMVLLATSPRCLGRTGHVELLLLLGNVGQDRT